MRSSLAAAPRGATIRCITARPPGPRTALRVVLDTKAHLANDSQLLGTAHEVPLLIVVGPTASTQDRERLQSAGAEVFVVQSTIISSVFTRSSSN